MRQVINDLYFDDTVVDGELRKLIESRISDDDVYAIFNREINLLALDDKLSTKTTLPAIVLRVVNPVPYDETQEDIQIQRNTRFTVELNVYTGGSNKSLNNMKLCNVLIRLLQSSGTLGEYYCRGLKLQENNEASSLISNTCRRVLRFRGICDNALKLIKFR